MNNTAKIALIGGILLVILVVIWYFLFSSDDDWMAFGWAGNQPYGRCLHVHQRVSGDIGHGLNIGDMVEVQSTDNPDYNGIYPVIAVADSNGTSYRGHCVGVPIESQSGATGKVRKVS